MICVIHVDDFIVVATDNHRIENLKRDLKRTYTLTEAPELESFRDVSEKQSRW